MKDGWLCKCALQDYEIYIEKYTQGNIHQEHIWNMGNKRDLGYYPLLSLSFRCIFLQNIGHSGSEHQQTHKPTMLETAKSCHLSFPGVMDQIFYSLAEDLLPWKWSIIQGEIVSRLLVSSVCCIFSMNVEIKVEYSLEQTAHLWGTGLQDFPILL